MPEWLPIKNRRKEEKKQPKKKTFKEQQDLKSQTFGIKVRGGD